MKYAQLLIYVVLGAFVAPATAQTRHVAVWMDQSAYTLAQDGAQGWSLGCTRDGFWQWEQTDLLEGAMGDLSLQVERHWLVLSGMAGAGSTLAGQPLPPGPFLILVNREDGRLAGLAALEGPADAFSVDVQNGVIACRLVGEGGVQTRYLTADQLQGGQEPEPVFIVDNTGSSSDPGGNNGGTGGGTGSGGTGSGSTSTTTPATTTG